MITKERLKELIEQKAKVYFIQNESFIAGYSSIAKIKELDLGEISIIVGHVDEFTHIAHLSNNELLDITNDKLYETKEEAEEYLEFDNITRTETLKLPSWEEVQKKLKLGGTWNIKFYSKNELHECYLSINAFNNTVIVLGYKCWDLTKENYDEARRVCKKLFLDGEKI